MFLFKIASVLVMPLAQTADQLQPWMIAAIAAGALLALLLLIFAARRSRRGKGEDLREAMAGAKAEAAGRMETEVDSVASWEGLAPEGSDAATLSEMADEVSAPKPSSGGRGKHAK